MSSTGSVTNLVKGLKAGDSAAIDGLLERYRARVTGLARKRLRGAPRMVEDEDDIANKALWSLCKGARDGKFPRLNDRQDLWGLLVVITIRKATDQIAFWNAAKRRPPKATDQAVGDDDLIQRGPGPETLNILCEEYDRLLELLGNDVLRQIAEWSVAGFQVEEIAEKIGCSRTTVFRKLRLIKKILIAGHPHERPSSK
jgi:DNA-directed RNA polymerase specialized sigma24 family protein